MSLVVMPVGVSNLYKLNLSLSSLAAGTYTAYMADGSSWSGEVTFSVSSNIFKPTSTVIQRWTRCTCDRELGSCDARPAFGESGGKQRH